MALTKDIVCPETEDRRMKLKVEIKPVSPGSCAVDNVNDIRSSVRGLNISATPTVRRLCVTLFFGCGAILKKILQ